MSLHIEQWKVEDLIAQWSIVIIIFFLCFIRILLSLVCLVLTAVTFWNVNAAELLTTNKLSELACLALYLMYEKKQGKMSFWYPYIRELDRQRGRGQLAVESPLLWSEAELNYLTGSPTKVWQALLFVSLESNANSFCFKSDLFLE